MTCKRNEVTAVFGGADGGLAVLMGADAAETVCRGCVGAPGKRGASGHAFALRLPSQASVGPSCPPGTSQHPRPSSLIGRLAHVCDMVRSVPLCPARRRHSGMARGAARRGRGQELRAPPPPGPARGLVSRPAIPWCERPPGLRDGVAWTRAWTGPHVLLNASGVQAEKCLGERLRGVVQWRGGAPRRPRCFLRPRPSAGPEPRLAFRLAEIH